LWDVKARKQVSLQEHDPKNKGTVPNIDNCSATFSPGGNTLAYCVDGGAEVLLWDLKTISQRSLKLTTTVRRVPGKIAFTADGKMIAATLGQPTAVEGFTGTNVIQFWDLKEGKQTSSLTGPADAAYADQGMAISPDGAMLAVVDENTHAIQLFDVKAGKATTLLKSHTDGVYTIAFSPDGNLLGSASYDKTVRLWDVKKGAQIVSLGGHKQGASSVIFSPNGSFLASGDLGGDVILWGVPVK
jgi:WD40 repeat protein